MNDSMRQIVVLWQERRKTLFIATCTEQLNMKLIQSLLDLLLEDPPAMKEFLWMKILLKLQFVIMLVTKLTIMVLFTLTRYRR